jgi:hypothetical protein
VFVALSNDGSTVLFHEGGKAGGALGAIYLRNVDGSPAVKLAEGYASALSPDKKWVLAQVPISPNPEFRIVPTGAGEPRTLMLTGIAQPAPFAFTADSKHVLINGFNSERKPQTFEADLDGGNLRPYTPAGTIVPGVAANGCCEARREGQNVYIWRLATATKEPIYIPANEQVVGASSDLEMLYLAERNGLHVKLWRMPRRGGPRQPIGEIAPRDATGIVSIDTIRVSNDGKTIVYGYTREVSDLYLARPAK